MCDKKLLLLFNKMSLVQRDAIKAEMVAPYYQSQYDAAVIAPWLVLPKKKFRRPRQVN